MGIVRQYTEIEVAGILKSSENQAVGGGGGTGHAEGLHELVAVGKNRASTSVEGLEERVVAERKEKAGAFDGTQVKAVTFALNSQAGQNTLTFLNNSKVAYVFTEINVASQGFKMKLTEAEIPKAGKKKAEGPINAPTTSSTTVACVDMKLIANGNTLHIRTAYPLAAPSGKGEHCEVYYNNGAAPQVDMPI
jgi:hypothetical protein